MKFTLTIESGNAAFDDDPLGELSHLVADVAIKLHNGNREGVLRDANGNKVGEWSIEGGK